LALTILRTKSKELFVRAEEVAEALGISKPYAYKLVREMNEELKQKQGVLRTFENDILGGLLAAASYREDEDEIHPVEIVRNGVRLSLIF